MTRAASRGLLTVVAAGALFGAGYAIGSYSATLAAARRRVEQRSRLAQTRFGVLEYAIAGHGEPFLMVHGAGGGFDQGLRFGQELIARGFEVIAPSCLDTCAATSRPILRRPVRRIHSRTCSIT